METKVISTIVAINPCYLDSNIRYHILTKLKNQNEGVCTFDNGHIIAVNRIIEIGENKISSASSYINFDIKYEITFLKPKIDNTYNGKVCMIIDNGIFVDIENKLKVLIPSSSLKNFTYSVSDNTFSKDNIMLCVDDSIKVIITAIKYDNNIFRCIGKIG